MRYFEDVDVGDTHKFGSYEVTREEIVEFAERWDPQPFHLNEEAARESIFGELVASGWHTAAICMRLLVKHHLSDRASAGARGVDELRWHQPVKPGDTLSVRTELLDKRPSESRWEIGNVRTKLTGLNQNDEAVISWIGLGMVRRRDRHNKDR